METNFVYPHSCAVYCTFDSFHAGMVDTPR